MTFTIDLRHPSEEVLDEAARLIADACQNESGSCRAELTETLRSAPVVFDTDIAALIAASARKHGYAECDIASGATHDAKYLATRCPTGMIFVPCRGGLSHHEAEYASPEHMAAGAQVLADVVLGLANAGLAMAPRR